MTIAELFDVGPNQAVKLPEGVRFRGHTVGVRTEGELVILEPLEPRRWPEGFFEQIRIDDEAFVRPDQGTLPPRQILTCRRAYDRLRGKRRKRR